MDWCRCSAPFRPSGPWPFVVSHTRTLGIGSDSAPGEVMKAMVMCKANCVLYVKRMLSCYGWIAVSKLAPYGINSIDYAGSQCNGLQETLDKKLARRSTRGFRCDLLGKWRTAQPT